MVDLYFEPQYGKLYEKLENGKCEVFEFSHSIGKVRHMFIKREIPGTINGEVYYDIITPYGYGGPVLSGCLPGKRQELVQEFHEAFSQYCAEERIVSEFIRFHPVLDNAEDFKEVYSVQYMRPTVGTNLLSFDDPVAREFSKTAKKNIRNAIGEGVQHRVIESPDSLDAFKEIYYATMKRKNADDYYFFDDEYFEGLLKGFRSQMLLTEASYKNRTIGMALTFRYRNFLHTHLSGTHEEYHHLYPAYVMQFALVKWGKENGFHLLHDGGGLTNSLEDSLFMFKKQFGKHTKFPFQIGKKIWDAEIYGMLCSAAGTETENDFFPAYRSGNAKEVTTA